MAWLLDTDMLSESSKQEPSEKVLAWIDAHDASLQCHVLELSRRAYDRRCPVGQRVNHEPSPRDGP